MQYIITNYITTYFITSISKNWNAKHETVKYILSYFVILDTDSKYHVTNCFMFYSNQ